jgi:hypothetical protein
MREDRPNYSGDSTMRKILWVIPCLALCCGFASSLWAAQPDLAAADWSVKSPHSLATNPPSHAAVLALLHKLTPDGHLYQLGICSSHLADLRHSGNLSLIVSVTDGRFCSLSIIDKIASGFEVYGADQPDTDLEDIEDLAGNGNLELILDAAFTGYQAVHHCMATWPVLFAWTGSGYTDVSSQYKGYYEQKLESLKKQIAASSSGTEQAQSPAAGQTPESQPTTIRHAHFGSPGAATSDLVRRELSTVQEESPPPAVTPAGMGADDCTEAEAAKIERFLGISRDAGMNDAIEWANSDAPFRREFAADVLQDIGTPDAIEYLRTLSNDSDRGVASSAKGSLEAVLRGVGQEGPDLYTVKREQVKQPLSESPPK